MIDLDRYYQLIKEYPQHFINNNEFLTIITDQNIIEDYICQHHVPIGVVYESHYHIFVVDLVKDQNNHYFTYDRIICENNGVLVITIYQNKYILLKQYRHALRNYQYSFLRGFGEEGTSSMNNALKEVREEINGNIIKIKQLPSIIADSGLTGNNVDVYVADVDSFELKSGCEGIKSILLVDEKELKEYIQKGLINDAMSLAAITLYWNNK